MAVIHHTNKLNGWNTRVTCGRGVFSRAGGSHLASEKRTEVECKRCLAALAKSDAKALAKHIRGLNAGASSGDTLLVTDPAIWLAHGFVAAQQIDDFLHAADRLESWMDGGECGKVLRSIEFRQLLGAAPMEPLT